MTDTSLEMKPGAGALKAGWACLVLGIILMLVPFPLFYLYWPLCIVAFILAIVVLSKGQTTNGIVLLAASILLPPIFYFIGLAIFGATYGQ